MVCLLSGATTGDRHYDALLPARNTEFWLQTTVGEEQRGQMQKKNTQKLLNKTEVPKLGRNKRGTGRSKTTQ